MFRFHFHCADKFRRHVFCLLAMTASSMAGAAEPEAKTWHHDWRSARQASQEEGRPILLYVTSKCCFYCEKMRHETYANTDVVGDIYHNFVPVSIDSKRHPELVEHLRVRRFPTTFIVGRDNRVVDSISGYVGPEQMRSWLKTSAAKNATSAIAQR
jgi:protein disulfide-isomerase